MGIYFIVLVIACVFCWLGNLGVNNRHKYRFFIFLAFVLLVGFAGFRNVSVGTDTSNYVRWFSNITSDWNQSAADGITITSEPGYYLLQRAVALFSSEYYALFLTTSCIFVFCVLFALNRYSTNGTLSLFVFICLGYYAFGFNAIRQALALGIYMLALKYVFERRFLKYCLVVLIAALFHKTIIIAIPVYFIIIQSFSWKKLLLLLAGGGLVIFFLPFFLQFGASLEFRYQLYQTEATGGAILTLFYAIMAVYFIIQRRFISSDVIARYDVFLNMVLLGAIVYLVVYLSGAYVELTRFAAYFQIGAAFLWPYILMRKTVTVNMIFTYVIFIIVHIVFYYIYLDKMADLVPYIFNTYL